MTLPAHPSPAIFLPENAPFTPEQRSWLNGFFAGLIALDGATALPLPNVVPGGQDDSEAPWHDQTIALPERMKLADGRPLRRRMMAAMAQQDCGQCGYNGSDYADVLFAKKETRLPLCVPGGKEPASMLKKLYEELDSEPLAAFLPAGGKMPDVAAAGPGVTRDRPAEAVFLSRKRLNKPGSEKETWHFEFDLTGTGINYQVGDSFGLFVRNDAVLVAQIIAALGVAPDFPIGARSL